MMTVVVQNPVVLLRYVDGHTLIGNILLDDQVMPKILTIILNAQTEIWLTGVLAALACRRVYSSEQADNGTVASPGYPRPYPPDTRCVYEFEGRPSQRVQLDFSDFSLYHPLEHPDDADMPEETGHDSRVEAIKDLAKTINTDVDDNVHISFNDNENWDDVVSEDSLVDNDEESDEVIGFNCDDVDALVAYARAGDRVHEIDRFCGSSALRPIMSSGPLLTLEFRGLHAGLHARGFLATYTFVEMENHYDAPITKDLDQCSKNWQNVNYAGGREKAKADELITRT
ncbi:Suppressor of lurcher protein 1 [Gryllus bimaculatus]|nr:Suppressor of lurcher protein 1 [Gryllus bimaculatus]